ncbi:MAG: hypothetical protein AMXMBFR31_23270 [Candidatus Desulfobacillus denitrificans]
MLNRGPYKIRNESAFVDCREIEIEPRPFHSHPCKVGVRREAKGSDGNRELGTPFEIKYQALALRIETNRDGARFR